MKIEIKSAVYTQTKDGNETQFPFNFYTKLSAMNKIKFVNTVVDTLTDSTNRRYNGIIKDMIFNFVIIDVFTDVDISKIRDAQDVITAIEDFLEETNIVEIVLANVDKKLIESLQIAINENIQYKTGVNPTSISSAVSELIGKLGNMLDGIDVSTLADFAQKVSGIDGNLTPERLFEAYSHSSAYQSLVNEKTKKDEHIGKIISMMKVKGENNGNSNNVTDNNNDSHDGAKVADKKIEYTNTEIETE